MSPAARVPRLSHWVKPFAPKVKRKEGSAEKSSSATVVSQWLHQLETAAPTSTLSVVTRDLNRAVVGVVVACSDKDKLLLRSSLHDSSKPEDWAKEEEEDIKRRENDPQMRTPRKCNNDAKHARASSRHLSNIMIMPSLSSLRAASNEVTSTEQKTVPNSPHHLTARP